MVKQYPHTLLFSYTGQATQNGSGDMVPGDQVSGSRACRAEPNSKNGHKVGADGTRIDFDWTVYLPSGGETIPVGSKVRVEYNSEVLCSDTIKLFSRGQLNQRIWL